MVRKTIALLDQVFPEYASSFSNIFAKTSLDETYTNGILDLEVDIAGKTKKVENSFSLEIILKH